MEQFRLMNLAAETYSILLNVVLLIYLFLSKDNYLHKSDKWFCSMILSNIGMLFGDMCDWGLSGIDTTISYVAIRAGSLLLFISSGLLFMSFIQYIRSYIEERVKIPELYYSIAFILASVQIILTIMTPFTGFYFRTTADNTYERGNLFLVSQIIPAFIYFMSCVILIKYKKYFSKKEYILFSLCFMIPMIAEIIQIIFYGIAILNISITFAIILIFINIQLEIGTKFKKKNQELADEKFRSIETQNKLTEQIITALSNTVEAKDKYTRGHSMRVAQYSREIVRRMGGSDEEQLRVYYIGLLHDVGKIRIPDTIINKEGRLTDEEFNQIKLHTTAGYHILKEIDVISDLAVGARWHHERYDGKGYPNGLAGENIPEIARIISVADAYDAMTSNRSYRNGLPQDVVRNEIEKGKGTQFDPKIADVMLQMIYEDKDYKMRQIKSEVKEHILAIDDDPMSLKFIEFTLKDEPQYELTKTISGNEGISLMKKNNFDLVLLDLEIPDKNGFEILEWIKKFRKDLPVILMTGDKQLKVIRQSEELGIKDYLTKPIMANSVRESISNVLRTSSRG
jgi:response regulator RpfG family c-di-GMP phosphodiesterase